MTICRVFRLSLPLLLAATGVSSAQEKELLRLDFTEPQIVLSPGGRTGACDVMRFAGKGSELLAVGDDKVVHTWAVDANGLTARPPLRWNVFRERRGSIYSLALSPDERFAAIGGFGQRTSNVVVIDRKTGSIVNALSPGLTPGYDKASSSVWHLSYNAAGDRIIVGHADGSVWHWTPPDAVVKVADLSDDDGYKDPAAYRTAIDNRSAKIVWTSFNKSAIRYARGDGTVWETDPAGANKRKLFRFEYPIAHVVSPDDGRWIAARPLKQGVNGSRVDVLAVPGGELVRSVKFEKNDKNEHRLFPVALATDGEGKRLAIGNSRLTGEYRFTATYPGEVAIYDLTPATPTLVAVEQFDGTAGKPAMAPDTLAFHPDGERLAIAGGHDHETALWRIAGGSLRRAGDPALSAGRGIWQVGTAKDGTVVTFRQAVATVPKTPNDRGAGDWRAFDVTKLAWVREATAPTEAALSEWAGWRVEFDPTSEFAWTVVHKSGFKYPLSITKGQDDRPWCYTFLPEGDEKKVRLAVGHYWGFSLYEFGTISKPQRVMKGVGHHGYVSSLAPARGGKMLVSGSSDQTIGLWSLEPWHDHALFGAKLEWQFVQQLQRRAFVVTAVNDGSPAWEAGLLKGDWIGQLALDGKAQPVADWEKVIQEDLVPDRELALLVQRPVGKEVVIVPTKTLLLTRPQTRFFPTAGEDWVTYRYADHFYAASPNGDGYLGWQIGGATAKDTPEFHPAARLRAVFDRPGFVAESVARLLREPNRPLARSFLPPEVQVTASTAAVSDKPLTLQIAVRPRADLLGKTAALEKVELWLDGEVLLQTWPGGTADFSTAATVNPEQLRVGPNKLSVVGYARTRGEASVQVTNTPPEARRASLRGLAVGVDKYAYLSEDRQLTASVNDARLMKVALESLGKDNGFHASSIDLLTDADATPDAILARIDDLGKALGPDDWFVIFLAGHGLAEVESGGFAPRVKPGSWFFCASRPADPVPPAKNPPARPGGLASERLDFAAARTKDQAAQMVARLKSLRATLTGEDLLDRIARMNCRKLVLLDACHSGAIALDPVRDLRPGGLGAVVLSASAPDESASEFDIPLVVNGKETSERHGFFSVAVYHALVRDRAAADLNRDGKLTLEELHRAVAARVTTSRRDAGIDVPGSRTQTVLASPADLRSLVFVSNR